MPETKKELSGEELHRKQLEWLKYMLLRCEQACYDSKLYAWNECGKCPEYKECYKAYNQIKSLIQQPQRKVRREDIFNFHQNLMTISEDSETAQECYDREIDYISQWLKELGYRVED